MRRVVCSPGYSSLRLVGEVVGEGSDQQGPYYRVRFPGYTPLLFRPDDIETVCDDGRPHEWEDGFCAKCFEGKNDE